MATTKVEFARDLAATKVAPEHLVAKEKMLLRAREGYYHDFQSPLAAPKMILVHDLEAIGLTDLAARVRNGEYDE